MKKIAATVLVSFSLLAIACANKSPQPMKDKNEIPTTNITNFLQGNRYHYLANIDTEGLEQVALNIANTQTDDKGHFIYGVYIEFVDSLHYKSYYTAPCGNDCFFEEIGKYYLPADNEIILIMDSIEYKYSGECRDRKPEYGNGEKKVYNTVRVNNDSTICLVKQK